MEKQSLFDLKNYLKDVLLVKVDMSSMLNSLELRVPLLDHNVVELALNINQNLKIQKTDQKYILKQILYDYLPKTFLNDLNGALEFLWKNGLEMILVMLLISI